MNMLNMNDMAVICDLTRNRKRPFFLRKTGCDKTQDYIEKQTHSLPRPLAYTSQADVLRVSPRVS